MLKLSKEAAQLVFNEISIPRGPSDRISAVIQMCLNAGAEVPGSKPVDSEPEPSPEPEPEEPDVVGEPSNSEDNVAGEGAAVDYDD